MVTKEQMTLHELQAEVEGAKGPMLLPSTHGDSGDAACRALFGPSFNFDEWGEFRDAMRGDLNACASLQERLLPGWFRRSSQFPATGWVVDLTRTSPPRIETGRHLSSEPIAWLAAIIRAKIAME